MLVDLPDDLSLAELSEVEGAQPGGNLTVRELSILRDQQRDDGRAEGVRWSLVLGAVVLTVVGIVISAAFAVGARRQLVTLGQLSASGASPATVRTALVLQGTVTGVVGALVGLGLAAAALLIGQPAGRTGPRQASRRLRPASVGGGRGRPHGGGGGHRGGAHPRPHRGARPHPGRAGRAPTADTGVADVSSRGVSSA